MKNDDYEVGSLDELAANLEGVTLVRSWTREEFANMDAEELKTATPALRRAYIREKNKAR